MPVDRLQTVEVSPTINDDAVGALAEALTSALSYALIRAQLPEWNETSRDYAKRLVPLIYESAYLKAWEATNQPTADSAQEIERLREALRTIQSQVNKTTAAYWTADEALQPAQPSQEQQSE